MYSATCCIFCTENELLTMMKKYRRQKGKRNRRHSSSLWQNKNCGTSVVGDDCLCIWEMSDIVCVVHNINNTSHVRATEQHPHCKSLNSLLMRVCWWCETVWQCWSHFYRAMLAQSAVMRLHVVCLSVRPSVCNDQVLWPHTLEFFENNFTAE